MKVLICGSRCLEVKDYSFVKGILTDIISKEQYDTATPNTDLEIVSGNANRGADWLGEKFARENKLALKLFPADWNDMTPPVIPGYNFYGSYNKLAAANRSQKMSDYLKDSKEKVIVIAFDAEESNPKTPTKNVIRISKRDGHKTYHVKCEDRNNVKIKVYNE